MINTRKYDTKHKQESYQHERQDQTAVTAAAQTTTTQNPAFTWKEYFP